MKHFSLVINILKLIGFVALTGCATKPYDYTNFNAHPPRSILVLPPLNEGTDMKGTYGYLSTVTRPIAEMGYYVFPVAVIDQYLKQNGMANPGEMHQVSPKKIREIIGADAVLYITLKQYGAKFVVVNSVTTVSADAKLVDTRTGTLLWEKTLYADSSQNNNNSGGLVGLLVAAVVTQVVSDVSDQAHDISRMANIGFADTNNGLLYGPYSPKHK
ncbi:MAG: GNA1162 family protein [Bdellovibrionales bacterium]